MIVMEEKGLIFAMFAFRREKGVDGISFAQKEKKDRCGTGNCTNVSK